LDLQKVITMKSPASQTIEPLILDTHTFKDEFKRCIRLHPRVLHIVVPYIGKIVAPYTDGAKYGSIVDFAKLLASMGCEFRLTTLPPTDKHSNRVSPKQAEELTMADATLFFMPDSRLHSKVYQFSFRGGGEASFVGSANFSLHGFEKNVETVAFFRSKADNIRVAEEIRRISAHGRAYQPYLEFNNARHR